MNDVALRANEVLRNDVGLRPMILRFAQTDIHGYAVIECNQLLLDKVKRICYN